MIEGVLTDAENSNSQLHKWKSSAPRSNITLKTEDLDTYGSHLSEDSNEGDEDKEEIDEQGEDDDYETLGEPGNDISQHLNKTGLLDFSANASSVRLQNLSDNQPIHVNLGFMICNNNLNVFKSNPKLKLMVKINEGLNDQHKRSVRQSTPAIECMVQKLKVYTFCLNNSIETHVVALEELNNFKNCNRNIRQELGEVKMEVEDLKCGLVGLTIEPLLLKVMAEASLRFAIFAVMKISQVKMTEMPFVNSASYPDEIERLKNKVAHQESTKAVTVIQKTPQTNIANFDNTKANSHTQLKELPLNLNSNVAPPTCVHSAPNLKTTFCTVLPAISTELS
ncbi:hypothetical protein BY996DRAFT_6480293 [Phakopsora pachyrhizi]|nr:hypothetical protein BY996DRAFT_6480293 [Phakopsora pachyrhizi]